MDDFSKYLRMKDQGFPPREVYVAGEHDGLDWITLIRMIRKVFALSLKEAKEISGAADALSKKTIVLPGEKVSWWGWSTDEGFYFIEAKVRAINGDWADLMDYKKYRTSPEGDVFEVPVIGSSFPAMKVSYLERPLVDRLCEYLVFQEKLSQLDWKMHKEAV